MISGIPTPLRLSRDLMTFSPDEYDIIHPRYICQLLHPKSILNDYHSKVDAVDAELPHEDWDTVSPNSKGQIITHQDMAASKSSVNSFKLDLKFKGLSVAVTSTKKKETTNAAYSKLFDEIYKHDIELYKAIIANAFCNKSKESLLQSCREFMEKKAEYSQMTNIIAQPLTEDSPLRTWRHVINNQSVIQDMTAYRFAQLIGGLNTRIDEVTSISPNNTTLVMTVMEIHPQTEIANLDMILGLNYHNRETQCSIGFRLLPHSIIENRLLTGAILAVLNDCYGYTNFASQLIRQQIYDHKYAKEVGSSARTRGVVREIEEINAISLSRLQVIELIRLILSERSFTSKMTDNLVRYQLTNEETHDVLNLCACKKMRQEVNMISERQGDEYLHHSIAFEWFGQTTVRHIKVKWITDKAVCYVTTCEIDGEVEFLIMRADI